MSSLGDKWYLTFSEIQIKYPRYLKADAREKLGKMSGKKPYTLNIDLNVLNHLGLNLYSNVPAVLSELIANAWDADASEVTVLVEGRQDNKTITISDNGHGMDDSDFRTKFLTVGYERRGGGGKGDKTKDKKRTIMGRKGIGKLSVFSIAKTIQIITKKREKETIAIEMDVDKIKEAIDHKKEYQPTILKKYPKDMDKLRSGTKLILKKLKKRVNSSFDQHLRQRIAHRFSVFSKEFTVFVNGEQITDADRNYFDKLECCLIYGDFSKSKFKHEKKYIKPRSNTLQGSQKVKGWLGLAKETRNLNKEWGNLNRIPLFVRGKIALEDMMSLYQEGGLYTKYITGEIYADFLDITKEDDISTSSRQDFIQDDKRFSALKDFVKQELKFLSKERVNLKNQEGKKEALKIPAIKEWYGTLKGDRENSAKKLFGRINAIATDDNQKKTLLKHGVLAFEHLQQKDRLNELEDIDINNLNSVVKLFSELDDIEATWYYEITQGRLKVIKKLSDHVNDDALEKIIQKHIYDHLWLLDPSWDRATEPPTLEKSVNTSFSKISDKNNKQKAGRIDIQYRKTSGKYVIIELKRGSVKTSTPKIMEQINPYKDALEKELLKANQEESFSIEAVCIVGKELEDWNNPKKKQASEQSLDAQNIRVVTYQQLIRDAEISYSQYLKKNEDKSRIRKILDEIDEHPI